MTARLTLTSAHTPRCGVACIAAGEVDMDGTRVTRDREYPAGGGSTGNRRDDNHWH